MIDVQEINQIECLAEFRPVWRALLDETVGASFFHSLEWLECYWEHFGRGQKLRILIVQRERRPVGILPLVVREERTRVGRVRTLTYPLQDWATFFGPIGPCAATTLTAGLRHVRRTSRDWDVLDLRWIDADGDDLGRTPQAMAEVGFRPCGQQWDRTSLVELPDTWQEYWASREPKFRKNIDRLERRLTEMGSVDFVRFRGNSSDVGENPRWDLYEACVGLARRSWQGQDGDKTNLCHDGVGSYFRDAHASAARYGATDVNLLCLDGRPMAFAYNYRWQGAVHGTRKGFDPEFAHLHPGLVLQKIMLEDGLRRGDRVYDLGTGDHHSKAPWRTNVRTSYRFTFFPAMVLRAQLLRCNRWFRRQLRGEHDIACSPGRGKMRK